MKKYIYILPFILGIFCFIISGISGSSIAPNGMLIEPFFFLIPIGVYTLLHRNNHVSY